MSTKISEGEKERIIKLINSEEETREQQANNDLPTLKAKNKLFLDTLKGLYQYYSYNNKTKQIVLNLIKKINYEVLTKKDKELLDLIINQLEKAESEKIEKLLKQTPAEPNLMDQIYFNNLIFLNKILWEISLEKSFFEHHIKMFELYKNKFTRIELLTKYYVKKKEFEKLCQDYQLIFKITPFDSFEEYKKKLISEKDLIEVINPIKKLTSMFEKKYKSFINKNKKEWRKVIKSTTISTVNQISNGGHDKSFEGIKKTTIIPRFPGKRVCSVCGKKFQRKRPGGSLICGPCNRKKRKEIINQYFKIDELPEDIRSIMIKARELRNEYLAEYLHRDDVKEKQRKRTEVTIPSIQVGGRKNYLDNKNAPLPKRGWTVDVLRVIHSLEKEEFTLNEVYAYEEELARNHPDNRHIKDKIRQQLQILRDKGILKFKNRGNYLILR